MLATIVSKKPARTRSPGYCEQEQNKFEPYGDLVDQTFSQFNENYINNQDSHSQIENDETPGAEYTNENYLEDTETKLPQFPNFMPKILPDDLIANFFSI